MRSTMLAAVVLMSGCGGRVGGDGLEPPSEEAPSDATASEGGTTTSGSGTTSSGSEDAGAADESSLYPDAAACPTRTEACGRVTPGVDPVGGLISGCTEYAWACGSVSFEFDESGCATSVRFHLDPRSSPNFADCIRGDLGKYRYACVAGKRVEAVLARCD